MIKSDLMNRKILLVMVLLFLFLLLTGCGKRPQPDVEHFQGEVVATLQKSASQTDDVMVDDTPTPTEAPQPSPQASEPIPTITPLSTLIPTVPNLQATSYPLNYTTTILPYDPYPTGDQTQTPASTPGTTTWGGVWKIWYQNTRGGYTPSELTVQVNGTKLTGLAKIDGIDFIFTGNIDAQTSEVEGEWETAADDGTFWWRMNSPDTFVGSSEERFGFCGNRGTAVQPNPCREVPQD